MDLFVRWCGAIGAWLLVAGPLYQGALELSDAAADVDFGDDEPEEVPGVSAWWWLLPPAAVLLIWLEERELRRLWESRWDDDERAAFGRFADRASGWLIVAAGAFFVALDLTWNLTSRLGWSTTAYWLVVPAATLACFLVTAVAISRQQHSKR